MRFHDFERFCWMSMSCTDTNRISWTSGMYVWKRYVRTCCQWNLWPRVQRFSSSFFIMIFIDSLGWGISIKFTWCSWISGMDAWKWWSLRSIPCWLHILWGPSWRYRFSYVFIVFVHTEFHRISYVLMGLHRTYRFSLDSKLASCPLRTFIVFHRISGFFMIFIAFHRFSLSFMDLWSAG